MALKPTHTRLVHHLLHTLDLIRDGRPIILATMSGAIVPLGASDRARESALALRVPTDLSIFRDIVPPSPQNNISRLFGFVGAHLGASPEELIREAKQHFDTNERFEQSAIRSNPGGEEGVRYRKAERLLKLALEREEALSSPGSLRSGILHNLIARHYTDGNESTALSHYRRAIEILIEKEGLSGRYLACALRDLGRHANKFANFHAGAYTRRTFEYTFEELPHYLEALEVLEFTARVHEQLDTEQVLGSKAAERARCLHRLGDCYRGLSAALRHAKSFRNESERLRTISIGHWESAFRLYEKTVPLGHPIRRDVLTSLIVAHMHSYRGPDAPVGEREAYWRGKAAVEDAVRNEPHTHSHVCEEITFPWLPERENSAWSSTTLLPEKN